MDSRIYYSYRGYGRYQSGYYYDDGYDYGSSQDYGTIHYPRPVTTPIFR